MRKFVMSSTALALGLLVEARAEYHAAPPAPVTPPPLTSEDPFAPRTPDASFCMAMDLRTSSMAAVPVRDQGPGPICYASTAAALIDAWRSVYQPGQNAGPTPVSAEHLAILSDLSHHRAVASSGGFVCDTWRIAQQGHACLASTFPPGFGIAEAARLSATLSAMRTPESIATHTLGDRALTCLEGAGFSRSGLITASEISRLATFSADIAFGERVLSEACGTGNRIDLSGSPSCQSNHPLSPGEGYRMLLSALDSSNGMPVSIGYCYSLLPSGRGVRALTWPTPAGLPGRTDRCSAHASAVIGRRLNPSTGRCQVLVRNSEGTACGTRYSRDWT